MKIYDHDHDMVVIHKNNYFELDTWVAHLEYVTNEIDSLLEIGELRLSSEHKVLPKLQEMKTENLQQWAAFIEYGNSMNVALECEDSDCDLYFLSEHGKFREQYLQHLETYRELKADLFAAIISK